MNETYDASTLDAMMGIYAPANNGWGLTAPNGLGFAVPMVSEVGNLHAVDTPSATNLNTLVARANAVDPYSFDMPSTANIDALVARANINALAARANAVKPQAQPVRQPTQPERNMAYTMGPSVTTSATNIPGQVQVNLNQRQMRFADPEYQRLYALQEARAREALARQGVSYPTAMNHAKNGTSY